ncbi:MAG: zinc ribbon domain-containing protein [Anaerolineales bacterium]|nr:zinc ribbon domain-containing protein [Anaerolineales bacterium]
MSQNICPSCKKELVNDFRFCPHCGYDLKKPVVCSNCQYSNEGNSKFCQECGTPLYSTSNTKAETKNAEAEPEILVGMEPPSKNGITIEFPFSTAQSFDFAVEAAKKFPTFKKFGQDKKALYRITIQPNEMETLAELLEHLKGWRKRTVYVNGEKVTWDSVFAFGWCHEKKKASFKPEFYCFGYENEYQLNAWGCIQANLSFTENAQWFCWGKWLSDKGDWKFDKERIFHELQKTLYQYRFCPALRPELIQDVLNALPDVVNPTKDKNWKFVERWGEENSPGLTVTVNRFGFNEKVVMKGVSPNGQGAIKEMAKRMKFPLSYIGR